MALGIRRLLVYAALLAGFIAVAFIASLVWMFAIITDAWGHEFYELQCCHNEDCAPVEDAAVAEFSSGFLITENGEFVSRGDPMVRRPLDERVHLCRNHRTGALLCIYPKLRGF